MKTIEEYLKDFPNASLAQYKEYCDDYKKKQFETEKQSKENYVGWLESMEGKWFVINFNGESYALMKYTKQNMNNVYPRSYHFVNKYNDCRIYDETSVRLNPLWLNDLNPYTNDYLAGYQRPAGVRWAKQVSDDFVVSVVAEYKKNIKDFYESFVCDAVNFVNS